MASLLASCPKQIYIKNPFFESRLNIKNDSQNHGFLAFGLSKLEIVLLLNGWKIPKWSQFA